MTAARVPQANPQTGDHGVVTIAQLLAFLRTKEARERYPAERIARRSKLPRSVVYRVLGGENVTLETAQQFLRGFGAQLVVLMPRKRRS